jgi:hypothetical protein
VRFGVAVAMTVVGLLTAAPAHADGAPFLDYLFLNGFGYLDAQRVLSDGAVACVNDRHDVPVELNVLMLTSRAYTEDEAKAVVAAERQALPQLC